MKNKYGNLSGGYIFDIIDKEAHKKAIECIGECETISATINYFGHITDKELKTKISLCAIVLNNKVIIDCNINNKVIARLLFLKINL